MIRQCDQDRALFATNVWAIKFRQPSPPGLRPEGDDKNSDNPLSKDLATIFKRPDWLASVASARCLHVKYAGTGLYGLTFNGKDSLSARPTIKSMQRICLQESSIQWQGFTQSYPERALCSERMYENSSRPLASPKPSSQPLLTLSFVQSRIVFISRSSRPVCMQNSR